MTHFTVQTETCSGETFAMRWEGDTLTGIALVCFDPDDPFLTQRFDDPAQFEALHFTERDSVPFDGSLSLAWARGEDGPIEWEAPSVNTYYAAGYRHP